MSYRQPTTSNSDVQAKTWLLPDDVEQMRDACLETFPPYLQDRNEAIIAFLYDTGLRREEAAQLDVENLNLDTGDVYLPGAIQKGDDTADLRLGLGKYGADSSRILRRYLRDRWKDTDALFPARSSDRLTGRSITRNVVKRAAEAADIEPQTVGGGSGDPSDVTAHTLRHSVAYRIVQERSGRLEEVQLRLRHNSRSTTDRIYSHLRPR